MSPILHDNAGNLPCGLWVIRMALRNEGVAGSAPAVLSTPRCNRNTLVRLHLPIVVRWQFRLARAVDRGGRGFRTCAGRAHTIKTPPITRHGTAQPRVRPACLDSPSFVQTAVYSHDRGPSPFPVRSKRASRRELRSIAIRSASVTAHPCPAASILVSRSRAAGGAPAATPVARTADHDGAGALCGIGREMQCDRPGRRDPRSATCPDAELI